MTPRRLIGACAVLVAWWLPATASACAAGSMNQEASALVVSASPDALTLRAGPTEIPLRLVRDARDVAPPRTLSARLQAEGAGRQIYLTFTGVSVQAQPGVVYNVYLNRPAGEGETGAASPHFLGTISFFNATPDPGREMALNVTPHLARLLGRGELDADLRLTMFRAGEPDPAAAPRIQSIRFVAR